MPIRQAKYLNGAVKARSARRVSASKKRARGQRDVVVPFSPPENWYDSTGRAGSYRICVQSPGEGYRHVVTPEEIRARLSQLPERFVRPLEVVQLSQMTRKKQTFPCYGMQWGTTLYLYPLEESLVEYFDRPPRPELVNETRMYGGRWIHEAPSSWQLVWTEKTIRDYYLNNILIHELGHLLDDRNTNYADRERYAEWFAIRYGYLPSRANRPANGRPIRRRHHVA